MACRDVATERGKEARGVDASADSLGLDDEPGVRHRDGGRARRVRVGGELPDEPGDGGLTKTQHRLDVSDGWRRREQRDRALQQGSARSKGLAGRRPRIQPEHLRRRELQDVAGRDDAQRRAEARSRDVRDLPGGRGTVTPADVGPQHANAGQRLPAINLRASEERSNEGGCERSDEHGEVERRAGAAAKGSCDEDGHLHGENARSQSRVPALLTLYGDAPA